MISLKIDKDIAIVDVEENLVSENIGEFEDRIEEMKYADYKLYIFNFSGVEYICSSALGILANVLRKSYETSATVYFCSLSSSLRNLFEMTKFLPMVKEADKVADVLVKEK